MGEIIKFDFLNKKRITEGKQIEESVQENISKEEIPERLPPYIKFIKFVLSDKYEKLKNLQVTHEALNVYMETVKNYTDEELIGWLENSSESEWKAKPSFYLSVYEELRERFPH